MKNGFDGPSSVHSTQPRKESVSLNTGLKKLHMETQRDKRVKTPQNIHELWDNIKITYT